MTRTDMPRSIAIVPGAPPAGHEHNKFRRPHGLALPFAL